MVGASRAIYPRLPGVLPLDLVEERCGQPGKIVGAQPYLMIIE
jgi:hypothetical protein